MKILISWDDEACVWIATCDEIGLVLESGSYDALIERIRISVPEQASMNNRTEYSYLICTEDRRMVCA